MTYNDVLARELKADVKVLIRDYFKSHEDEQQFPRELLYQFIEQFDIFSLLLDHFLLLTWLFYPFSHSLVIGTLHLAI